MFSGFFADVNQLRVRRGKLQQLMVRQLVEENDIRRFETALAFERDQFRITRTRRRPENLADGRERSSISCPPMENPSPCAAARHRLLVRAGAIPDPAR